MVHDAVVHVVGARGHAVKVGEDDLREDVERGGDKGAEVLGREERAVRGVMHRQDEPLREHHPRHRQVDGHPPQCTRVARQHEELHGAREDKPERDLEKGEREAQVARVVEDLVAQVLLHARRQPDERLVPHTVEVGHRQLDRLAVVRLACLEQRFVDSARWVVLHLRHQNLLQRRHDSHVGRELLAQ